MKSQGTIENTPSKESARFFCVALNLSLHGEHSRGTWSESLDTGEGFSIKRQIFTRAPISLIRNKVGRASWRRHMGDGCTSLSTRNVHTIYMLFRATHILVQPGFVVHILHVCASSWCGVKPLAKQVHLVPHIWQSPCPQHSCCCCSVSCVSPRFFLLQK